MGPISDPVGTFVNVLLDCVILCFLGYSELAGQEVCSVVTEKTNDSEIGPWLSSLSKEIFTCQKGVI